MTFYIYENWTRDRGRIHLGSCSYCNHGKGMHDEDSGANGRWHGPYDDREQTFRIAAALKRADMRPCGTCNP